MFYTIAKLEFLSLPYYGDEAWVYGNAVSTFIINGIPLLPSENILDLTRGHPLFFYILFSIWGRLIGDSSTLIHVLPLLLSVSFFAFLFFKTSKIISKDVALLAIYYLVGNEIFFTQSSLVLPEVLLGFLLLLSFISFVLKKWYAFVLLFTLALLTKESAIAIFPALIIVSTFAFYNERDYKLLLKKCLIILVPLFLFSLHFIYQKYAFGWFFYPKHVGYLDFGIDSISERFSGYLKNIFEFRLQFIFTILFLLSIILIMWRQRRTIPRTVASLICALIVGVIWIACDYYNGSYLLLSGLYMFVVIGLSLLNIPYKSLDQKYFIAGSWLFVGGYILFSSLNFYSIRYITTAIIFYAIVLNFVFVLALQPIKKGKFIIPVIMLLILLLGKNQKKSFEDVDTGYKYCIKVLEDMTRYMVENIDTSANLNTGFIERMALSNSNCKFIQKEKEFHKFYLPEEENKNYLIISNIEGSIEKKRKYTGSRPWKLIKSISHKKCLLEIYSDGD